MTRLAGALGKIEWILRLGWATRRRTRLAAGVVLFAYVVEHLANLAIGNVSVTAMEAALGVQKRVWGSPPGAILLYASLLIHLALGFQALYERRRFRRSLREWLQLALGLGIPFLLAGHIVSTRVGLARFGLDKGYAEELLKFWVLSPGSGAIQALLVLCVWIHGCIGVDSWLALRPRYARGRQIAFALAVLIPTLALVGYWQGGRAVSLAYDDPLWRAAHASAERMGTASENLQLARMTTRIEVLLAVTLAATLLTLLVRRFRETRCDAFVIAFPQRSIRAARGMSVLEAAMSQNVPLAHVCGGRGRCSTCRISVVGVPSALPSPSAEEQAVLDRIRAGPGVRLACQLRPTGDVSAAPLLPANVTVEAAIRRGPTHFGNERFLVPMFVDMRGSTELAERRLPFDTVFLINRFLEAVSSAAIAAGGAPNQILGDGLLILFGLEASPAEAARQAIDCCWRIAENIAALNASLPPELATPIRFGVGAHAGHVVVGDIGYEKHAAFTAIGDAVNVAARLQELSKSLGSEVVISEDVHLKSGLNLAAFALMEAKARGRAGALQVRCIRSAVDLKAAFVASNGAAAATRF